MLEINDLAKRYGSVTALDGASFTASPGRIVGFLGPNGAGKTTTMRVIFGLASPDRGEVRWAGAPVDRNARLRFGYMPEQRGLYPRMRVAEQLSYFAQQHGLGGKAANAAANHWLERMGLADRAKSKLEELSHGNQQRVQLATALVHDPELLVLDEPFSGLDPIGIATMTEVIRERAAAGVGVVFSSHQLDLVEDVCEDVVIIARGRIVASGGIEALKTASGRQHLEVEVVGSDGTWLDGQGDLDRPRPLERQGQAAGRPRGRPRRAAREGAPGGRGAHLRLSAAEAVGAVHGSGRLQRRRDGGGPMSRWRSIWLVARREILERGRSRGFIFSVLFTTAIVIGSFALTSILRGGDAQVKVGVVVPAPAGLETTLQAASSGFDKTLVLTDFADRTAAEAALTADQVEAVVDVPADLSAPGEVVYKQDADQILQSIVGASVVSLRSNVVLAQSNVDQTALAAAHVPPTAVELDPRTDADKARFLFANISTILILVGIFSFGFTVLTGVVEEKQSRVVEVVLSTVRPRDLLMGKVLGIGILGLVQLAVFMGAALIAARVTGSFELPSTTPVGLVMLVVWFILGYTLYSTALGFLGALASRMEEASNASTPVTMIAMISYFVAILSVLNDPTGTVARIATFLPPSAPMVVPLRVALDAIEPWEVVVSFVITVAAIWALFTIGARVYAGAVLHVGGRMKLRDAWRSAGK